MPPVFYT